MNAINNNKLTDEFIQRIVVEFVSREDVNHFASCVSFEKIKKNDYNLTVSTFVELEDTREVIDIKQINADIEKIIGIEQTLCDEITKIISEIEGDENE